MAPRAEPPGYAVPPDLLQQTIEAADNAARAVGPETVLAVLRRLRLGADPDVRRVVVEVEALASGDVKVTARPDFVTISRRP